MKKHYDYYGAGGSVYEPQSSCLAWTSIEVLPSLVGHQWDEIALAYVHALRPSIIRVIRDGEGEHCDSRTWRVTVYVDANNTITEIRQEVELAPHLPMCGEHVAVALKYGMGSPEEQWYDKSQRETMAKLYTRD
jgi:hypothetical protein